VVLLFLLTKNISFYCRGLHFKKPAETFVSQTVSEFKKAP